ncbi:oxidoreductase [Xylaria bambusicola]|uniref:oxidoreductase n=1 Tax=Xylaria bambusicola TaxID=326684 RepID=UPI002007B771|nr:oxidoreductase [Xylaria bambusicola]KAI0506835.1 oxidoreductase [Xylaria bambusicola]
MAWNCDKCKDTLKFVAEFEDTIVGNKQLAYWSGIGCESALAFAERGVRVAVFADLNLDAALTASERSKDIATAKDCETVALHVPQRVAADILTVNEPDYNYLQEINLKGILHCLQKDISAMKDQEAQFAEGRSGRREVGPGAIINITSLSALSGTVQSTTYVASKFAARGIIKCDALENCASGLRINEVCLGFTNTPMLQRGIQKQPGGGEILNKSMLLGCVAMPEEIASVVHFLASPSASFITCRSIAVDAGVSVNVLTRTFFFSDWTETESCLVQIWIEI